MKIKLRYIVDFEAEINDTPLDGIDENSPQYPTFEVLQEFLKEFVKHKDAVLQFYRNTLVEQTMLSEYIDFEKIKRLIKYEESHSQLFKDIASNCEKVVKRFITNLYKDFHLSQSQINKSEYYRDLLEDHFGPLRVEALSFNLLVNPPTGKNDEKS